MPTFRGEDGLWEDHRPEELATPRAFSRDPRLVWEWYAWRRSQARSCEPAEGHLALARWTVRAPGVWIATQNVDGLHGEALRRVRDDGAAPGRSGADGPGAGAPSGGDAGDAGDADDAPSAADRLLELHGSLFRVRCTGCGRRTEHRSAVDASSRDTLPRCPECGELLRPDVVWFGESLDPRVLRTAREAGEAAEVCLSVGTSAAVEPAASLARAAAASGAGLVEINPEETALSSLAAVAVRRGAADVLPRLLDPRV
jgi:NAD-dependent deacetylase